MQKKEKPNSGYLYPTRIRSCTIRVLPASVSNTKISESISKKQIFVISVSDGYIRPDFTLALRPEVHERTSHVPVWVGHTTTSIPGRAKSVKRHETPCVCVWMRQLSGTTQGTRWGPRRQWRRMSTLDRFGACKRAGGCGLWLVSPWVVLYPRRTRTSISSRTYLPTLPVQQQGPFLNININKATLIQSPTSLLQDYINLRH